jgi:radical SAM superfamily enzyme YgiQ (UPF0313 family)
MKITLISLDELVISYGLRTISACLKEKGHDVRMVFLRSVIGEPLPAGALDQAAALCAGSGLVGVSVMSSYFHQAAQLTAAVKKVTSAPVVWGGIHPTFYPEQCLKHADGVCIGEGELSTVELAGRLAAGVPYTDTPGFWFPGPGGPVKNAPLPLVQDLDSFPNPDYGPAGHYVRDGAALRPMDGDLLCACLTRRRLPDGATVPEYYVTTSRGCPYRCSYCISSSVKDLSPGQKVHRLRGIDKVMADVSGLKAAYPFIKAVYFSDDDLFAAPLERLREFAARWKAGIGLPFYCTCAPWTYDEEKMKVLAGAGMLYFNLGIQSISEAGMAAFTRRMDVKKLRGIIASAARFPGIIPSYDFIVDNPYESDADRLTNLAFIAEIPFPREIKVFSLVPFPGTAIHARFVKDGLLRDEDAQIYLKNYGIPQATYMNFLFYLASRRVPSGVLRALSARPALVLFNNRLAGPALFRLARRLSEPFILALAGLRALRRLEFYRYARFFRRKFSGAKD